MMMGRELYTHNPKSLFSNFTKGAESMILIGAISVDRCAEIKHAVPLQWRNQLRQVWRKVAWKRGK